MGITTTPTTPYDSLAYAGVAIAWMCLVTQPTALSFKHVLASSFWMLYFAVVFWWRSAIAISVMVSTIYGSSNRKWPQVAQACTAIPLLLP